MREWRERRGVLETRAEVSSKGQMVDALDTVVMSLDCAAAVECPM